MLPYGSYLITWSLPTLRSTSLTWRIALGSAIYAEFVTVERISVKIALDSMSELYYKSLKNAYTGYAGVTLRQLLDHLVPTYAAIYQCDLEKNQEK